MTKSPEKKDKTGGGPEFKTINLGGLYMKKGRGEGRRPPDHKIKGATTHLRITGRESTD